MPKRIKSICGVRHRCSCQWRWILDGWPYSGLVPLFFLTGDGFPMTVRLETSMVCPRSDVVRRDIRLSSAHPMAVGSDVRVGRFGWVSYILWIAVCYQGSCNKSVALLRTRFYSLLIIRILYAKQLKISREPQII